LIWQITYITWIHILTAVISLQVVFTVYKMQLVRGRMPFLWMMFLSATWSIILSFESASTVIHEKVFLSRLEYFCMMSIPVLFLNYILSMNIYKPVPLKRYRILLWIIPAAAVLMVNTNDYHHLIWTGFTWSEAGENILVYHHGPVFYIATAYSLLLVIVSNLLLLSFIRERPNYYKQKAAYLIAASVFPLLTGFLYASGLSPVEGLDISPMGIMISGILFFWGIAREEIFDIVPVGKQFMIEKMKDGVLVLDNDRFIMDINPAGLSILLVKNILLGRRLDILIPQLKEFLIKAAVETEHREEIFFDNPVNRWFEVSGNPLRDSKHRHLGTLIILHDITPRKESEMKLKKLADELSETNKMKDRLYAIISHDLRSPFNSIMGFSDLLSESYDDFSEEERKQFAFNISSSSKIVFNLLENLLEWSAIQLGKIPIQPAEIDMNFMVSEVFTQLQFQVTQKEIKLVNKVPAGHHANADRNMIQIVLRNIISNGIKYSQPGGTILVESELMQSTIEISVIDFGIGMTELTLSRLFDFENLQSTPGTSKEKGTGLGLILSKEIIEKNGGTIRVFSEPLKGTKVLFSLHI